MVHSIDRNSIQWCDMGRYQLQLAPCETTSSSSWGIILASENSLVGLWENTRFFADQLTFEQKRVIVDTKTGKILSDVEALNIVSKLKGW